MSEPTQEQIEAAAKAIWDLHVRENDPAWGGSLDYGIKEIYRRDARAALVAAAGAGAATPRPASNARVVTRGVGSDCATGVCPGWCSHLMWFCDQCSCEGGWGGTEELLAQLAAEHTCPPCLTGDGGQTKLKETSNKEEQET